MSKDTVDTSEVDELRKQQEGMQKAELDALDSLEALEPAATGQQIETKVNDARETVSLREMGDMGEEVARERTGRTDLNAVDLPMQGDNFPIYDNAGEDGVASVKVYGTGEDGDPSAGTVGSYMRAFDEARGFADTPKWNKTANLLSLGSAQGVAMPSEIANASSLAEIQRYLRQHAQLQVPDNHLDAVRNAVAAEMREFPGNSGLPEGLSEEQINRIAAERVIPIGATTAQLRNMIIQGRTH